MLHKFPTYLKETNYQPVNELWDLCSVFIIFLGHIHWTLKWEQTEWNIYSLTLQQKLIFTNILNTQAHFSPHPVQCWGHVDVYGLECREQPETTTLKGEQRKETLVNSLYVISSKVLKLFVTDVAGFIKGHASSLGWGGKGGLLWGVMDTKTSRWGISRSWRIRA